MLPENTNFESRNVITWGKGMFILPEKKEKRKENYKVNKLLKEYDPSLKQIGIQNSFDRFSFDPNIHNSPWKQRGHKIGKTVKAIRMC